MECPPHVESILSSTPVSVGEVAASASKFLAQFGHYLRPSGAYDLPVLESPPWGDRGGGTPRSGAKRESYCGGPPPDAYNNLAGFVESHLGKRPSTPWKGSSHEGDTAFKLETPDEDTAIVHVAAGGGEPTPKQKQQLEKKEAKLREKHAKEERRREKKEAKRARKEAKKEEKQKRKREEKEEKRKAKRQKVLVKKEV